MGAAGLATPCDSDRAREGAAGLWTTIRPAPDAPLPTPRNRLTTGSDGQPVTCLTVNEIRRMHAIFCRPDWPPGHYLHWSRWRRRHQATARAGREPNSNKITMTANFAASLVTCGNAIKTGLALPARPRKCHPKSCLGTPAREMLTPGQAMCLKSPNLTNRCDADRCREN